MADRKLQVTVPNKNWMKGFRVQKARTDLQTYRTGSAAITRMVLERRILNHGV